MKFFFDSRRLDDPAVQNRLCLGPAENTKLVQCDLRLLRHHSHVAGDARSGKTSRGVLPPVIQLMRQGQHHIVYCDLKSDTGTFQLLQEQATRARSMPRTTEEHE